MLAKNSKVLETFTPLAAEFIVLQELKPNKTMVSRTSRAFGKNLSPTLALPIKLEIKCYNKIFKTLTTIAAKTTATHLDLKDIHDDFSVCSGVDELRSKKNFALDGPRSGDKEHVCSSRRG